jgi:hypothetical protein
MARVVMDADLLHEHVAQTIGHPRLAPARGASSPTSSSSCPKPATPTRRCSRRPATRRPR